MERSKILIVSQRDRADGFGRQPGYVSFTEAEDVLAACVDADIVHLSESLGQVGVRALRMAGRAARRTLRTGPFGAGGADPALDPRRAAAPGRALRRGGLHRLHGLGPPATRSGYPGSARWPTRSWVWFPEVWATNLADPRVVHEPYGMADAIFVGMKAASERLGDIAQAPVHHVPTRRRRHPLCRLDRR